MSKLRIFATLTLFAFIGHQLSGQNWNLDLQEALNLSSPENRPVLIVFQGSDWCVPCIKLEREVWETSEFEAYAKEHLILLKVDFPRRKKNALSSEQTQHNEQLADRYNQQGMFPLVVMINSNGEVLGETGYKNMSATDYINHLQTFTNR